jgi:hypothetical protein
MDVKMSKVIDRWIDENDEKEGAYAAFAGFEKIMNARSNVYNELDILDQLKLFDIITNLLTEEHELTKNDCLEDPAKRLEQLSIF